MLPYIAYMDPMGDSIYMRISWAFMDINGIKRPYYEKLR